MSVLQSVTCYKTDGDIGLAEARRPDPADGLSSLGTQGSGASA
jgi:hypothetical protein